MAKNYSCFPAIYELVREIPKGEVASYGMVASLISGATARIVGYAMAGTPEGQNIPWQRVINAAGKISDRDGADRHRKCLEGDGIIFTKSGKVTWATYRWSGPSEKWLDTHNIDFMDFLEIQREWPGNK